MQGRIDVVRPDGLIEGWCWDEESPESRVSITVLIDGIEAGSSIAALYREDLRLAKMGDGFCAFSFVTQILPSSDRRTQNYILIETESRRPVGTPLVVHNERAISLDDRLLELETKSRLLTSRLEEFTQREAQTAYSQLFSVVGEFFTELAKNMQRGEPLGVDRRLSDIVDSAAKAHRSILFPIPERPVMTILVRACASLAHVHACLAGLQRAGAGDFAEIVVLDDGAAQDAILLPSIVRGIRYVRTAAELTAEWSEAERLNDAEFVLLLSGTAVVSESCLRELITGFADNGNAAAIGAQALVSDAPVSGGGLCLIGEKLADCARAGHPEAEADLSGSHPVHALSSQAAAFRRSALRAVGGLDEAFRDDVEAAVIDLCFRLRQRGWAVLAQPEATLEIQSTFTDENSIRRAFVGDSHSSELLRVRWLDARATQPPLFIGHAAIVGQAAASKEDLAAVRRLRERGYSVDYLGHADLSTEQIRELRRLGARVIVAEDTGHALRECGATLVYAAAHSAILDLKPEGSQLFIGHAALEHMRAPDAAPGASEERVRQVAGL